MKKSKKKPTRGSSRITSWASLLLLLHFDASRWSQPFWVLIAWARDAPHWWWRQPFYVFFFLNALRWWEWWPYSLGICTLVISVTTASFLFSTLLLFPFKLSSIPWYLTWLYQKIPINVSSPYPCMTDWFRPLPLFFYWYITIWPYTHWVPFFFI